jgi:hypothetical protein
MADIKDIELDKIIRKCYTSVIRSDINNTFVIYEDNDKIIEIPHDIEKRVLAIDKLIFYFQELEEYERCHQLVLIKQKANQLGQ